VGGGRIGREIHDITCWRFFGERRCMAGPYSQFWLNIASDISLFQGGFRLVASRKALGL
jgi:hypothetical protein